MLTCVTRRGCWNPAPRGGIDPGFMCDSSPGSTTAFAGTQWNWLQTPNSCVVFKWFLPVVRVVFLKKGTALDQFLWDCFTAIDPVKL